jgi:hypothetical protein
MTAPDDNVVRLDDFRRPTPAEVDDTVVTTVLATLEKIEAEYRAHGDVLGAELADLFRRAIKGPE